MFIQHCGSCQTYQSEFFVIAKDIKEQVENRMYRERVRSGRPTTISSIPYEEVIIVLYILIENITYFFNFLV